MRKRSRTLKHKAHKRDDFTCQKCGLEDKEMIKIEAHHIIPLCFGGKDDLNNLITLCFDCHRFAPDKLEDFEEYMKEEMEGTLTILMKAWKNVIKEQPELFEQLDKGEIERNGIRRD